MFVTCAFTVFKLFSRQITKGIRRLTSSMAKHLVLLVSLTVVIPRTVQSVCVNSVGRCCNIRDQLETCGPMQFCSTSSLDKGCRNCSEISQHWCDKDPEQFLQQYPNCAILCTSESLSLSLSACSISLT